MKKHEKNLLIAAGIIVAVGFIIAWRKKKKITGAVQTMIGTNADTGAPIIAVKPADTSGAAPVDIAYYQSPPPANTDGFEMAPQMSVSMDKFRSAAGGGGTYRWVVGGYNAAAGGTWVFPEGNLGGGHFIQGHINAPQGTYFNPA